MLADFDTWLQKYEFNTFLLQHYTKWSGFYFLNGRKRSLTIFLNKKCSYFSLTYTIIFSISRHLIRLEEPNGGWTKEFLALSTGYGLVVVVLPTWLTVKMYVTEAECYLSLFACFSSLFACFSYFMIFASLFVTSTLTLIRTGSSARGSAKRWRWSRNSKMEVESQGCEKGE